MTSISFKNLRINNAEQFKESVSEPSPNTHLYLTYGKCDSWVNDSSPNTPNATIVSTYEVWYNMIGGKKITGNDMQHVIPKNAWASGQVYYAYDDRSTDLANDSTKFYVLTSANRVYKCIANANNAGATSTVEPSYVGTQIGSVETDGYIWKYMYTLSASDLLNFTTTSYMPVKTLEGDDGTDQWDVQQAAISGGIHSVVVSNTGSGYTNTSNVLITLTGDGSSFEANVVLNLTSQTVSSITITDPGVGYTFANVTISGGGGSGAKGRAIISPPGGHGSNPLYELGGSKVMINAKLIGTENGVLPTTNDFRQVALIKDPYLNNSTSVASNVATFQGLTLTMVGYGDYTEDEFVYQGIDVASAEFKARVLSWDSANSTLKVVSPVGTPVYAALVGETSAAARIIASIGNQALEPNSGQVLYIDNIVPITRAPDQTENIKIVLNF